MKVIYAPNKIPTRVDADCLMLFLAGSIEMPEGFYRKGNVDIVCERYGIPQIKNLTEIRDYF